MGKMQTLTTDAGEELVVLARRDYDALMARAGDAAGEDAMTARIVSETDGATAIPERVWVEIENGVSPLKAIRAWRKLTQERLAYYSGVSQPYIATLEGGGKTGSPATLAKLAKALKVTVDDLLPVED